MHPTMHKPNISPFPQARISAQRDRRAGPVRGWLRAAFINWERRKMIETLRAMDDHLLRDIGIDRSDIPRVVDGFTEREIRMRPVSSEVEHDYRRRREQAA